MERDENGDMRLNLPPMDWQRHSRWRTTYIFRRWDATQMRFRPYFDIRDGDDRQMDQARNLDGFREIELYKSPEKPPYDSYIHRSNFQLGLMIEFFKEVLDENSFEQGHLPQNKFYCLVMPVELHERILNVFNDHHLLQVRDMLLEVIARAQEKYIRDVHFWETPEMKKMVANADMEANKAIDIIDRIQPNSSLDHASKKKPAQLLRINFVFDDGTIKLEDPWLTRDMIEAFKDYYNDRQFKDYRLELIHSAHSIEGRTMGQFKFHLAKAFYNLLTKAGLYSINKSKPYPNELMLCIAKLIEFCLIPVGSDGETDEVKIKHIRNWIKRHDIPEAITYKDVLPDRTRLLKYFEKDFIDITGNQKRADALSIAYYLAIRFDLGHLFNDLAHLAQILKEGSFSWGHQVFYQGDIDRGQFPEFKSLRTLVAAIRNKKKITGLKFTIDAAEEEHIFTQRLPLYFIERAFSDFISDHQVEMDTDVLDVNEDDRTSNSKAHNKFKQPEERLSVKFVKALYNYLLNEAPPKDNDFMPSEKYYLVIAALLQRTWFFYQMNDPEWLLVQRIKRWHQLA